MPRQRQSARKLTLIAFFCVAASTVYGGATRTPDPTETPAVKQVPLGRPATEDSRARGEQVRQGSLDNNHFKDTDTTHRLR